MAFPYERRAPEPIVGKRPSPALCEPPARPASGEPCQRARTWGAASAALRAPVAAARFMDSIVTLPR